MSDLINKIGSIRIWIAIVSLIFTAGFILAYGIGVRFYDVKNKHIKAGEEESVGNGLIMVGIIVLIIGYVFFIFRNSTTLQAGLLVSNVMSD